MLLDAQKVTCANVARVRMLAEMYVDVARNVAVQRCSAVPLSTMMSLQLRWQVLVLPTCFCKEEEGGGGGGGEERNRMR